MRLQLKDNKNLYHLLAFRSKKKIPKMRHKAKLALWMMIWDDLTYSWVKFIE